MKSLRALVVERFGGLNEIQKAAIPKILNRENVLIIAPTGCGKTEASLLPILEMIITKKILEDNNGIFALFITPLRALNRDLLGRIVWWCEQVDVTCDVRHGDSTQTERVRHRKSPPQIMITTPETLQALLVGKIMRKHLSKVNVVVVDEIHELLDNKRGAQLSISLERLAELTEFQRIGLSATIGNQKEAERFLFGEREGTVVKPTVEKMFEIRTFYEEDKQKRIERIKEILKRHRCIIFVNTRRTAEVLTSQLKEEKLNVKIHHSSLSKDVRTNVEEELKQGKIDGVIATSSLELGIDVGKIDFIIQYSSPRQVARLIQRIGRGGHTLSECSKGEIIALDADDYLESEAIRSLLAHVEEKRIERMCKDVIAHQVVGMTMCGRRKINEVHKTLSRSYCYGITIDELKEIVSQIANERLVFFDDENISVRRKGRMFYYENLSTIPKERKLAVRDSEMNKVIATLDEEFVVNLEIGTNFLIGGVGWKVLDIGEEVLVERCDESELVVPAWTGENIPLPYDVAQKVGELRKGFMKGKKEKFADEKTIYVELIDNVVIVHCCFGTKANETFGRILSNRLSKVIGQRVRVAVDPYRILFECSSPLTNKHIETMFQIRHVEDELEDALQGSTLLKYVFNRIAKSFGLSFSKKMIGWRYINMFKGNVVYKEALRELFHRYLDVERVKEVVTRMKNKEIDLVVERKNEPSLFGKIGLERCHGGEITGTTEPKELVLKLFKEKIGEKFLTLECAACEASWMKKIKNIDEPIICVKCGSGDITFGERDREYVRNLIVSYGKRAVIALSVYGVGPKSADRILRRLHRTDDAFYLDLLEEQKKFIRTRKYWRI